MPPFNEHTISTPLPESELRQVIHDAYGDDESTAMLTQVNHYLIIFAILTLILHTIFQHLGTISLFSYVCKNGTTTIFRNVKTSSWLNYSSYGRGIV